MLISHESTSFRIIMLKKTLEITLKPLVYVQHCNQTDPVKTCKNIALLLGSPQRHPSSLRGSPKPSPQGTRRSLPYLLRPSSLTM